jgi:hypothetical protein
LVSAYLDALVAHRCTGSRHAAALYFASEWCLDRLPLGELSDVALREIDSFHDALFEGRGLRELAHRLDADLAVVDAQFGSRHLAVTSTSR